MTHLRAQSCDFGGVPKRFCQKCSRFHELDAFEARACAKKPQSPAAPASDRFWDGQFGMLFCVCAR
jgi:hypothetical protein